MKRILSILMSVSLVVIMLISMSVTSFAWQEQPEMWVGSDDFGDMTLSVTEITDDATKDQICMDFIDAGYEDVASCFAEDIYFFNIKAKLTNLATYTTKTGLKWYGSWFSGTSCGFYFDINDVAYSEDTGYITLKYGEDDGGIGFSTTEYQGMFTVKRAEDNAQTTLLNLPPMNGTAEAHTVGDGASDFNYEFVIATNTKTFDFQIVDLCYSVCELTSEQAVNAKNFAPSGLSQEESTKRELRFPYTVYSVVDGELAVDEPEPATHAFVVYGEGDVEIANETLEEGEVITMPTAPAVEGKTFSHWATTEGGSAVEPATTMGTEDLTYYAVYTVNKYTITFKADGAVISTQTVEHGAMPEIPAVNVDGFTFGGWDNEVVAATADATYTAILTPNAPTQYEITFVVDGDETIVMTNAGDTPEYPNGTPSKAGHTFEGWTPALAPATANATYEAVFTPIPAVDSKVTITAVERITGDIFPDSGNATVEVTTLSGKEETIEAARLHRVHTTFDYEAGDNPLDEMGMLFVPKAVVDEAKIEATVDAIVAAGIAKDANCSSLPGEITGGTTNVVFKAGLVNVPEAYKGITIYAIPYYTLSGGTRQYHGVIETTF